MGTSTKKFDIKKHVMTGISYMIPVVVCGGILCALAKGFGGYDICLLYTSQGAGDKAYDRIKDQIPSYMGFVFEEMCKQYLWQENLKGNAPVDFTNLGRWWGNDPVEKKEVEIDIIADNEENEAIFAECKWRNEDVGESVLKELQHRSTLFHYRRCV